MTRARAVVLAVMVALTVVGGCASPAEKADQAIIRARRDPGAEAAAGVRVAGPGAAATPATPGRPVPGRGPGLSAASSQPAPVRVAQAGARPGGTRPAGAGGGEDAPPAGAAPVAGRPTREGIVVAVRGESVYVDLGRDDGVAVGQRLRVVRAGAPLVHPVTGETLGAVDDEIAQLEVTAVAEKFATTRVVHAGSGAAIEPKDRVVAWPAAPAGPTASGPTARQAPAAPSPGSAPQAPAPTAAAQETAPPGVALDAGRSVTSQELAYEIRDLATGDLDGDGRVELVALNPSQLVIYRWTGKSLELLFEEEASSRRNYISADAADLDGDGRAELLVNDAFGYGVSAAILQHDGRRFVRRDLPRDHYFRILGAEVGAPTLVGQRRGDGAEPFQGRVYRYEWRRGKARRGEALWTPDRASIFDLQLYRAADGTLELAALSPTGHLRLFRGHEEVWSSQQDFGGTKLRVAEKNPAPLQSSSGEEKIETPIPGRIVPLAGVTGGGGPVPAFALVVNEKGSFIAPRWSFSKGSVVALAVEGRVTRELWRTATFEGYIAAQRVADLGPASGGVAGRALLVAIDLQKGLFRAARSVVLVQPLR